MKDQHPSRRIRSTISDQLKDKRIVLGITGSVAAFKSPEIARELIRLGAEVIPVMSDAGSKMIGTDLIWWATGIKPITEITGRLEHISLAGVMNKPADLMIIAPCTTNTIAKLASGIADTPVTIIASSLHGKGIPIIILGVAHEDLIRSPPVQKAIKQLKTGGIHFIEPFHSEGKAKMPNIEDIIYEIRNLLSPKTLEGKSIVITGGPTREYIDNVRFITNSSSGTTGIEIAKEAKLHGANVLLILGPTNLTIPRIINVKQVISSQEMTNEALNFLEKNSNATAILSAAMADFTPKETETGKIKSGNELIIEFIPTTKLSNKIKPKFPECQLILFKAEWNVDRKELIQRAIEKMRGCQADFIIANDLSRPDAGFKIKSNHVFVINQNGSITEIKTSKSELAREIINLLSI